MEGAPLLTRYEVSRLLGLRSLQLSEGVRPEVLVEDEALREDFLYVAGMELRFGALDARVVRRSGEEIDVRRARLPPCVDIFLRTRVGEPRGYELRSVPSFPGVERSL